MKDDKKSSIIKEALTDYNAIREAADANAKKTISSVKARVCESNLEPSVGTRISIKFSADN